MCPSGLDSGNECGDPDFPLCGEHPSLGVLRGQENRAESDEADHWYHLSAIGLVANK